MPQALGWSEGGHCAPQGEKGLGTGGDSSRVWEDLAFVLRCGQAGEVRRGNAHRAIPGAAVCRGQASLAPASLWGARRLSTGHRESSMRSQRRQTHCWARVCLAYQQRWAPPRAEFPRTPASQVAEREAEAPSPKAVLPPFLTAVATCWVSGEKRDSGPLSRCAPCGPRLPLSPGGRLGVEVARCHRFQA